jgi:UDP-N-acetylmuramyl pentapeptide synthase
MTARVLDRWVDWLATDGKEAAKTLYQQPVIRTGRLWRRGLRGTRFIGITGSAAKTTTKDLLHAILAGHAPSTRCSDSNNELYNVARTLLGTGPQHRYCVQELGASEPGCFEPMLDVLQPQVGVLTGIGMDHYTAFRTREAVAAEKGKLIRALPPDGLAILNADDALALGMRDSSRAPVVTFGLQAPADYRGEVLASSWPDRLRLRISSPAGTTEIATRFCGAHQSVAVLAAVATACSLGVPLSAAAERIATVEPPLGRMSVFATQRGVTFLRDDWKAPLWSVSLAFDCVASSRAARKVIVLGSLSDINGNNGRRYRQTTTAALSAADHVVAIGDWAASVAFHLRDSAAGRLSAFDTIEQASAWLWGFLRPGDLVLLKGSNTADHLARLALAADRDVHCWRRNCGRQVICDRCRLLEVRPSSHEASHAGR